MDEFASRHYPVREDMRFQRRSWMVERAGWLLLASIAGLGLTGVFGMGPLSVAQAGSGPLTVRYDRFQRATRTVEFVFTVAPSASTEIALHLNPAFQRDFEVVSVSPGSLRGRLGDAGYDMAFARRAGAESRIVIWARPRHYGLSRLAAATGDAAPAKFWVFVYP